MCPSNSLESCVDLLGVPKAAATGCPEDAPPFQSVSQQQKLLVRTWMEMHSVLQKDCATTKGGRPPAPCVSRTVWAVQWGEHWGTQSLQSQLFRTQG